MTTSGYDIRYILEEAQVRWLKPGEVLFILQNYEETQLTHKAPEKPPSGSLFLFDRKVLRFFRKDGHSWRKKKDGRTIGEAHERLKVGNVEALNCYYAHGDQDPNFQRRCYWMLNSAMENIVLVHYRDTTLGRNVTRSMSALSPGSPSTLIQSSNYSQLTTSHEIGQLHEITSSPSCIEVSSDSVTNTLGTISGSPTSKVDQALRKIEEQLSLDDEERQDLDAFHGEIENSYDSGLTVDEQSYNAFHGMPGYSGRVHEYPQYLQDESTLTSQQNSFWKDMLIYDEGGAGGGEDLKFPSNTPARNPDYSTMFDQKHIRIPSGPDSTLTIAQDQKFVVREISPEWGYANESTKVFMIGTFTCDSSKSEWSCMFGDTKVPVKIIQDGVICCQAPPCSHGKVSVSLNCGTQESVKEFEYRDKPINTSEKESSKSLEELLLLVRLVQTLQFDQDAQKGENKRIDDSWGQLIEALLDGSLASSDAIDWVLEQLLKEKLQQWLSSRLLDKGLLSKREQGMIHMVSGLGFCWALSPILNSGVSVNFRDINGWTALHWAARFGREKMVAELLAAGAFAGAITDPNKQDPTGKTAASIASACGHKGLAGYLSEMALTGHLSSLKLQESENSKTFADVEAERTVNGLVVNEDHLTLKNTLTAVRNATQAAARIQSAFRAHSFRRRKIKESEEYDFEDEYGIMLSEASKSNFRNPHDHYAAVSIQKKYRGWKGRKDFVSLRQKVVKIQAHVRGHQVRKSYKVICWAVGMVDKIILRWRRKGAGLRGFRHMEGEDEDEDVVKVFRKEKVDVAIGEAVSRVLSMAESKPARQQYCRMLENHRQAKAERGGFGGEVTNMEKDELYY